MNAGRKETKGMNQSHLFSSEDQRVVEEQSREERKRRKSISRSSRQSSKDRRTFVLVPAVARVSSYHSVSLLLLDLSLEAMIAPGIIVCSH